MVGTCNTSSPVSALTCGPAVHRYAQKPEGSRGYGDADNSPGGPGLTKHQGPLPKVSCISLSPPPMLLKLQMALLDPTLPKDEPSGPN